MCAQWSYGVTVWEVFNGGRTPYAAVDPLSLIRLLEEGRRLERPLNAACATEMCVHALSYYAYWNSI